MDTLPILEKCASRVRKDVLPFYNTPNAGITFGRGAGGDKMKKIDLVAEKAIIETIEENKISCTLISEETGTKKIGQNPGDFYLTVDPIDGTTNAIRGIPFINTSLAVSKTLNLKDINTALITDLIHNTTYSARKGRGAYKNKRSIHPSKNKNLETAVLGIDLNTYKIKRIAPKLNSVIEKTGHIRHFGANALELCYIADGTTDAFIDLRSKLRVTDIAAAYLIIREAGGVILTPQGKELDVPLSPTQRISFIAAGSRPLYQNLKENIAEHLDLWGQLAFTQRIT